MEDRRTGEGAAEEDAVVDGDGSRRRWDGGEEVRGVERVGHLANERGRSRGVTVGGKETIPTRLSMDLVASTGRVGLYYDCTALFTLSRPS